MIKYTELETTIQRENIDGTFSFIPKDEGNSDYQSYLASLDTPQA